MESMSRYKSKVNRNAEEFKKNYEEMSKAVDELNERLGMAMYQGKEDQIERYRKAGRLLGTYILNRREYNSMEWCSKREN